MKLFTIHIYCHYAYERDKMINSSFKLKLITQWLELLLPQVWLTKHVDWKQPKSETSKTSPQGAHWKFSSGMTDVKRPRLNSHRGQPNAKKSNLLNKLTLWKFSSLMTEVYIRLTEVQKGTTKLQKGITVVQEYKIEQQWAF